MALPDDESLPRPDVPEWLMWVWRAWHRLSADRPWRGGGLGASIPGMIPWRDVRAWCEFYGMPGDSVDFLDACVRAMDAEYIEWWAAQQPKR